jgi:hypothetical protein
MVGSRAVTVFTGYDCMGRSHDAFIFVWVAIFAVFRALILDLEILPELDIAFLIPAVHVTPSVHAEILRYVEITGDQDDADKTYNYP